MIPIGRKWITLMLLAGIIALNWQRAALIFPLSLILVGLTLPRAFAPFRYVKFWTIFLVILFIFPFFTGDLDASILGLSYSTGRMKDTIVMSIRGILIFLLMQVLTSNLTTGELKRFFSRIGLPQFDGIAEHALQLIPKIRSIIQARYAMNRDGLRAGTMLRSVYQMAIDLFVDMLHLALPDEDCREMTCGEIGEIMAKDMLLENQIFLLAGDEHAGKTTCLRNIIRQMVHNGKMVSGIVSPGEMLGDRKSVIHAEDISSGERKLLAESRRFKTRVMVGKYHFHETSLSWANDRLLQDPGADLTVVDEFGILELKGNGFFPGMQPNLATLPSHLLLSIRSSLKVPVIEFLRRYQPEAVITYFQLTKHTG